MQTAEMMRTHPEPTNEQLASVIEELMACAQTCTACADACLGEKEHLPTLGPCIRLNLDCADICQTTARVLTRQVAFEPTVARRLLEACAESCRACGDECQQHASMMEHCRICAEACRRCEQACRRAIEQLAA